MARQTVETTKSPHPHKEDGGFVVHHGAMSIRQRLIERRLRRDPQAALHSQLAALESKEAGLDEKLVQCAHCGKALPAVVHTEDPAFCSLDCGYNYNGLLRD